MHESSNTQYEGYSTIGKMTTQNETDAVPGVMQHLNHFQIILLKTSTYTIQPIYFQKCTSLFPEESVEIQYSITKTEDWWDHNRNYPGNHHFPGPPNDTRWIVSS